jgi:putative hydroxymethylpyrimidine transport system substrate-binding protein
MKVAGALLALWSLVAFLAGCGAGSSPETTEKPPPRPTKPQPFHVTLDGYPNPENVGILMAERRGYFADVGLEVEVTSPVTPLNVVGYVTEGAIDLGVSHQPQAVIAKEEGMPIVAVGSLVPRPTMAMIWLKKSGIDGIADLKGKTVAIVGFPFEEGLLQSLLARADLTLDDVKVRPVSYRLVPTLVSGRADAIFGGSWNVEGAELETRGLEPVVTRVQSLGIPDYEELVLIARPDRLAEDPRSIRAFLSAVARGAAAAVADPKAAVKAIMAARAELEPGYRPKPKVVQAELAATLPLLSEGNRMSPGRAMRLVDWMQEEGLIRRRLPASDLLTNDYLGPEL